MPSDSQPGSSPTGDADPQPEMAQSGMAQSGIGSSSLGLEAARDASDHELVRAALGGEEVAFQALVERHQNRAYRVARQMVPSREDALDLAQEAFLRVFKNLHRFDFDHEFSTWLYRIVSNLAIDHLRKRRPLLAARGEDPDEAPPETVDESAPAPFARLESEETAERVRACIEALAPHFRTVLALRELEGLPCTEISRIVGATHVTVRWRLHRARKLFQEEWERRERLAVAQRGATPNEFGATAQLDPTPGHSDNGGDDSGARPQ